MVSSEIVFSLFMVKNETVAWETFVHEVLEFKLKEITDVYQALVNSLISGYESFFTRERKKS
jgi:hypothetical protein